MFSQIVVFSLNKVPPCSVGNTHFFWKLSCRGVENLNGLFALLLIVDIVGYSEDDIFAYQAAGPFFGIHFITIGNYAGYGTNCTVRVL